MLRRTITFRSGLNKEYLFPHGVPKRTFPLREELLHIQNAPLPGGSFITKYALGLPFQFPYNFYFYRSSLVVFVLCVTYDLIWGVPLPFCPESVPGKPHHFFFGNNGGVPHHFWEYQDGWKVPNMSGARRWIE